MAVDIEIFKNQISKISTSNIIILVQETLAFLQNVKEYSTSIANRNEFKGVYNLFYTNNTLKETFTKLLSINLNYNLLQANLIGFSPANSNMWRIVTDETTLGELKGGLLVCDIYTDLNKYNVDDYVSYKDNFYQCINNNPSDVGLFKFYDILEEVISILRVSDDILIVEKLNTFCDYLSNNSSSSSSSSFSSSSSSNNVSSNSSSSSNLYSSIKDVVIVLAERYKYLFSKNDNESVNYRCYDFIVKKLNQDFNFYRYYELQEDDTLNFAEKMRELSTNDDWKNNDSLWSIVAAACNDVGSEFHSKIKKYILNISDVDTCNLKALKSIASSVSYKSDVLNISNNSTIPVELERLIDLFSINRKILFDSRYGVLSNSSVLDLVGYIDSERSVDSNILGLDENKQLKERIPYNVIYKIKTNIVKIKSILYNNTESLLNFGKNIVDKSWVVCNSDEISGEESLWTESASYEVNNKVKIVVNREELYFKCVKNNSFHPLTFINYINDIMKLSLKDLSKYQNPYIDGGNPFLSLIKLLQHNIVVYDTYNNSWSLLDLIYINEKTGTQENLLDLFVNIVQSIKQYDLNYKYQFVLFHIFGLFYSKIFNYELDPSYSHPSQSISEYDLNQFYQSTTEYLSNVDLDDKYLKPNSLITTDGTTGVSYLTKNVTQNNLDFVKYVTFLINNLNYISDVSEESSNSTKYYTHYYSLTTEEQALLIQHIIRLSSYLTDYCIKLSYERELIKKQIKIYALTGTNQIIQDVLADYFLENFTRNDNDLFSGVDYQKIETDQESGDQIIHNYHHYINTKEELQKTLSPFTIEFVEYQDNTNYFNIESNVPQQLTGQKIVGYQKYIHESINNKGQLITEEREKPIYEDVYSDVVISDANVQYWDSVNTLSNGDYIDSYIEYYRHWVGDNLDFNTYMVDTVPFIESLYGSFNTSGTGDEELDTWLKFNSDTKINSNIRNHKNKYFPSIATLQFLPNLVEVSNVYKDDSMILSKTIYDSAVQYLNAMLSDIIANLDYKRDDYYSIIKNGWKTDLVEFNGYTTYYEDSNNKDSLDLYSDSRIDVDGPWVYSSLQQFLYMYYSQLFSCQYDISGNLLSQGTGTYNCDYVKIHNDYIDKFIENEFVYDKQEAESFKSDSSIRGLYKKYLIDFSKTNYTAVNKSEGYDAQVRNMFNTSNINNLVTLDTPSKVTNGCLINLIKQCCIYKFEKDVYDNQYTLFKKKTFNSFEDVGQLWMRYYNHPLSLPFEAFIDSKKTSNTTIQTIISIANKCMYFKCIENTMMLFGYDEDSKLRCIIFNFTYGSGSIYIDIDVNSVEFLSTDNSKIISHINTFVGDYVDQDGHLNVILYNYSLLYQQNENDYIIELTRYRYNINKGYIDIIKPFRTDVDGVHVMYKPLLKEFFEGSSIKDRSARYYIVKKYLTDICVNEDSSNAIKNTYNHIWNVNYNKNKNQLYIGFEFYNNKFALTTDKTAVVDDYYEGYQKGVFNCPVVKCIVKYQNEAVNSQVVCNIAQSLQVQLYNIPFELLYSTNSDHADTPIALDSIIELKSYFNKQQRNVVSCEDVIIVPLWTLLNDSSVNITDKTNATKEESLYIYNTYIDLNGLNTQNKSSALYTKLITYFTNKNNELCSNVKTLLNNIKTNTNIFSISNPKDLYNNNEVFEYQIVDINTYNTCIQSFSDCMNCMNQVGLMKFNFADIFNVDNISNNLNKNALELKNKSIMFDELDLDISVGCKEDDEYIQSVGWKCDNTVSTHLNWLSSDNQFGGPEIVSFFDSATKQNSVTYTYPIQTHWFSDAITPTFSSLEIFYKGFYTKKYFVTLPHDNGCSINNIMDVKLTYTKAENGRVLLTNIEAPLKLIYYGLLVEYSGYSNSATAKSMKLIYSTNQKYENSCESISKVLVYSEMFFDAAGDYVNQNNQWIKVSSYQTYLAEFNDGVWTVGVAEFNSENNKWVIVDTIPNDKITVDYNTLNYYVIGTVNQENIINNYIENINGFGSVSVRGTDQSLFEYMGNYYPTDGNNNKWNCDDVLSNNKTYTAVFNNGNWTLYNTLGNPIDSSAADFSDVRKVNSMTLTEYIFNEMYNKLKIKMFENINKRIITNKRFKYSEKCVYNEGDQVIYNNAFYVCQHNNITGAFDATKWQINSNITVHNENSVYKFNDQVIYNNNLYICRGVTGLFNASKWSVDNTIGEYNESTIYNENTQVVRENCLYTCKYDNVTGVFDPSKWAFNEVIVKYNNKGIYNKNDKVIYNNKVYTCLGVKGEINTDEWVVNDLNVSVSNVYNVQKYGLFVNDLIGTTKDNYVVLRNFINIGDFKQYTKNMIEMIVNTI